MSELQTVRKKIQGDFFLEKSYKEGKLFYEVLRYKDDYIGINYGYLDDELREETGRKYAKYKRNLKEWIKFMKKYLINNEYTY